VALIQLLGSHNDRWVDKEAVSVVMLSTTSGNKVGDVGKGKAMLSQ
jgi:hypothetical protein